MTLFRILLAIDGLVGLVVVHFLLEGLGDGSVSAFNAGIWLALVAGVAAVPGVGIALHRAGWPWAACGVLALLAVPAIGAVLLMVLLVVLNPRWN